MSGVPRGSLLTAILFKVFVTSMDSRIECSLSKFIESSTLLGEDITLEEGMPPRENMSCFG